MAEQLKSNRTQILEKLFEEKSSKHFIRSDKITIFHGRCEAEKAQSLPKENINLKSPEVEKVKKSLNFEEVKCIKFVKDISKVKSVQEKVLEDCSSEDKNKNPNLIKDQKVKLVKLDSDFFYKRQFRLKDCSVVLKRLKPQQRYVSDKNLARSDCFVKLTDVKLHPKYGPKVHEILGTKFPKPEKVLETKSDLLELDINKNLSPKFCPPTFSSTPAKLKNPILKEANPVSEQVNPIQPSTVQEENFDLFSVKKRLEEGAYSDLLDFHLDIKRMRNSAKIGGPAKKSVLAKFDSAYEKAMAEVYPWFNVNNPAEFHEPEKGPAGAVSAPTSDHVYSSKICPENKNEKNGELNLVSFWKSKYQNVKERRFCALCCKLGDAAHDRAGRLLYFRQNEWVHVG